MSYIQEWPDGLLIALKQLVRLRVDNDPQNEQERKELASIETELQTRRNRLNADAMASPHPISGA